MRAPSLEYQAALAELRRVHRNLRQMRRDDKQVQRIIKKIGELSQSDFDSNTAEAIWLLKDPNLEWSSDMNDIREPMAELIKAAYFYPTLRPLAVQLGLELTQTYLERE